MSSGSVSLELTNQGLKILLKNSGKFQEAELDCAVCLQLLGLPRRVSGKEPACHRRGHGWIPGLGTPPEEGVATQPNAPAWAIPRTEEPAGLQSMRPQRVSLDLATQQQRNKSNCLQSICVAFTVLYIAFALC